MSKRFDFSNPYKVVFLLWSLGLTILLPYLSFDAGITEDEPQHLLHGNTILNWYLGHDSTAALSPFDKEGKWLFMSEGNGSKTAINLYGGFFDLLAAAQHHFLFSSMDEYESKHMLSALFGALLFIIIGLTVHRITNSWAAAVLALFLATFTPRLFGFSLSNPKDLPLATFFALSILQMVAFLKSVPKIKIGQLILLSLSFSFALAVRTGAILLLFYFLTFTALYIWWLCKSEDIEKKAGIKLFSISVLVAIAGYFGTSLLWPWAMQNPLVNPLKTFAVFRSFDMINIPEVFEGKWLGRNNFPWYYAPKWVYITLPFTILIGFTLFFTLLPKFLKQSKFNLVSYSLLLFSIGFPLASVIYSHTNLYNNARHITFIIPSIVIIAALAWHQLFKSVKGNYLKLSVGLTFAVIAAEPVLFVWNNHPLQSMYFSPVIGGAKGAFKNYEMDYWGYSVKPALDWIEKNDSISTPEKKARVRMWYGDQIKLKHLADKSTRLEYVATEENSTAWDYFIELPASAKYANDILYHWPPKGTIHEIMVDGAPVCAIIKNWRTAPTVATTSPAALVENSAKGYLNAGLGYYNQKDFNRAILQFKKASAIEPKNMLLYNNLVAAFNELRMFDDAIEIGKKALAIDPNFQLLKNNLAETYKAKNAIVKNEAYYITLSYNYYIQEEFERSIEAAKTILKLNPSNVLAWNNICSAYNQLGQYEKAINACDNGLKLAPTNQLLQNNRTEAVKGKEKAI